MNRSSRGTVGVHSESFSEQQIANSEVTHSLLFAQRLQGMKPAKKS
jgi:hypothetical protein